MYHIKLALSNWAGISGVVLLGVLGATSHPPTIEQSIVLKSSVHVLAPIE